MDARHAGLLVSEDGDWVAAPGEYFLSFELGGEAVAVDGVCVRMAGPLTVVERFPQVVSES